MAFPNLLYISFVVSALAQFVPQPPASAFTNATGYAGVPVRYKEVPTGICELDPHVMSYSGYAVGSSPEIPQMEQLLTLLFC